MKKSENIVAVFSPHSPLARALAVFLLVGLAAAVSFPRENALLSVSFLDVGQGDAIFIRTPSGKKMLIDGGPPSGAVLRALGRSMDPFDRYLDIVVATHPDKDHIGGLAAVLERYRPSVFFFSSAEKDTSVFTDLRRAAEVRAKDGMRAFPVSRRARIDFGDGVIARILFPDRNMAGAESNAASVVISLSYGDTAFLFTGDLPAGGEKYLARTRDVSADVLKLGHHGSRTSSSDEFLAAAGAVYGVVSAGRKNRYGHPHEETLRRAASAGVRMFSTAEDGTLVFFSDGENILPPR